MATRTRKQTRKTIVKIETAPEVLTPETAIESLETKQNRDLQSLTDLATVALSETTEDKSIEELTQRVQDAQYEYGLFARKTAIHYWRLGRDLDALHSRIEHGGWQKFLGTIGVSTDMDFKTRKLFERYGANPQGLEDQAVSKVLVDLRIQPDKSKTTAATATNPVTGETVTSPTPVNQGPPPDLTPLVWDVIEDQDGTLVCVWEIVEAVAKDGTLKTSGGKYPLADNPPRTRRDALAQYRDGLIDQVTRVEKMMEESK